MTACPPPPGLSWLAQQYAHVDSATVDAAYSVDRIHRLDLSRVGSRPAAAHGGSDASLVPIPSLSQRYYTLLRDMVISDLAGVLTRSVVSRIEHGMTELVCVASPALSAANASC